MRRARGKRYDEKPKLNIKKVFATIIAFAVIIMFVISLKNLLIMSENTEVTSNAVTYFSAYENDKWCVIDNEGKKILENNEEMVVVPDKNKDLFLCYYDVNYENGEYKTKVLNKSKKEILTNYDSIEAIENYDENSIWYEKDILKYKKDGKYGLINFNGKEILPAEYDKIYAMPGIEKSIIIQKDGLYGLVSNSLGEIIVDVKYAEITSLGKTYENGYIVKNTESYYGVITTDKKEILPCKYDKINKISSNELFSVVEGGKNKLVNKLGEDVLTEGFSEVVDVDGENIIIKNGEKYGVMDINGKIQIPTEYDYLSYTYDKAYIAKKDNKFGLIKLGNEVLIDFKYNYMSYRKIANFIEADDENYKTDIIDRNFKVVMSGVIISDINTEKGYIRIRLDDNYKYYNFKFEEKKLQDLVPTNTLFLVKENGKYGYENKAGQKVVDCIYDDATEQNDYGYVSVKKGNVWGSLKSDGTVCLEPSVDLDENIKIDFINTWHIDKNSNMNVYVK